LSSFFWNWIPGTHSRSAHSENLNLHHGSDLHRNRLPQPVAVIINSLGKSLFGWLQNLFWQAFGDSWWTHNVRQQWIHVGSCLKVVGKPSLSNWWIEESHQISSRRRYSLESSVFDLEISFFAWTLDFDISFPQNCFQIRKGDQFVDAKWIALHAWYRRH